MVHECKNVLVVLVFAQALLVSAQYVDEEVPGQQGRIFTRWGRQTCPAGSSLVYVGEAAGGLRSHSGSGSNLQCLNGQDFDEGNYDIQDTASGILYTVEYETTGMLNAHFDALHNYEVPCVVCRAPRRPWTRYGSATCPTGHSLIYNGYLFTSRTGQRRTQATCMDRYAESIGSKGNEDNVQLSPTETFRVHGYTDYLETTCAVCGAPEEGAVYIRYGKHACGSTSTAIDYGVAAGADYTLSGGVSQFLCMTNQTQVLDVKTGNQASAEIEQAEFQTGDSNLNPLFESLHDHEATCVVCQAPTLRTNVLMHPGTTICPTGWTREYFGYLLSSHYTHKRVNGICMDEKPDKFGTSSSQNGALLYFAEMRDAAAFPTYTNNLELTCAVCTRSGGSIYFDIGSTSCPTGDSEVYSGRVAGAFYTHSGGPNQPLCMANTSNYLSTNTAASNGARIYRAEYQLNGMSSAKFSALKDKDVPCTICQRPSLRDSFMMPARTSCPPNYKPDFSGIMVSSKHDHQRTLFMCMQTDNIETVGTSSSNNNALLFYSVEIHTGSKSFLFGPRQYYDLPCTMCSGPAVPPPPPPPPTTTTGPTFVRWGRWDCPVGSEIVYQGRGAGARYDQKGNGFEQLCMPPDLDFEPGSWSQGADTRGMVAAMEYQTSTSPFLKELHDMDVPCVLCKYRVRMDAKITQLEGREDCPTGFNTLYKGWLFAERKSHYRSKHICVDQQAQGIGSTGDENGGLLYPVEADGFPGYGDHKELTCAVCVSASASRNGYIYRRWGVGSCPSGHTALRTGMMAASPNGDRGGGADWICLPSSPQYRDADTADSSVARVTRVEYKTAQQNVGGKWNTLDNWDAACAVCQAPANREYGLMIPGRTSCNSGDSLIYKGYIMAPEYRRQKLTFICVDEAATASGTAGAQSSAWLYMTETHTGNNALPGYTRYREVQCAMCLAPSTAGSTYMRAGAEDCPSGDTALYQGLLAGTFYTHAGSGHNLLCMHPTPQYTLPFNNGNKWGAILYRTEYETGDNTVRALSKNNNKDVSCTVCRRPKSRAFGMMVPGTRSCPSGYKVDYQGYFMTAYSGYARQDWQCIDLQADSLNTGTVNQNGALLYSASLHPVNGRSLSPTAEGDYKELDCVVCNGNTNGAGYVPPTPPPPPTGKGEVWTRFGRRDCPAGSVLVYFGVGGGKSSTEYSGSGYNPQCLRRDPDLSDTFSDDNVGGGLIYRMEYQTSGQAVPQAFLDVHETEVPCAVCQYIAAGTDRLTVHGTDTCPSGYTQDFQGLMFSTHTSHRRGQSHCIDMDPQPDGSGGNENGYIIYPTETRSVPGYANYRELSCVQCRSTSYGSSYVRWGVTSCPSGQTRVHHGVVAGSYYTHSGGPTDPLCMITTPKYGIAGSTSDNSGSQIYPAELEFSRWPFLSSFHNYEMRCAVCAPPAANKHTFMLPGTTSCPSGYQENYDGYLVTSHRSHKRLQAICMDQNPVKYGSSGSVNGMLLYFVETMGGADALSTDYIASREVTCVSCSSQSNQGATRQTEIVTYWAKDTCPSGGTKVYDGIAAGSHSSHGSSANPLCMSKTPSYLSFDTGFDDAARLYRMEFEVTDSRYPQRWRDVNAFDLPCIVCHRPTTAPVGFVQGGSWTCPATFGREYKGYLFSEKHDAAGPSMYTCIPDSPDVVAGSGTARTGPRYMFVESHGNVPHGYPRYLEIPCAMCAKCDSDSFSNGITCGALTNCGPGEYAAPHTSNSADRLCLTCPPGKYQNADSHRDAQCKTPRSTCPGGSIITAPSTIFNDIICQACPSGQYSSSGVCQDFTTCGLGTKSTRGPTATSDRVCTACEDGKYQDQTSHTLTSCKGPVSCGRGQFVKTNVTATSNIDCDPCPTTKYQDSTAHYDTSCKSPSFCGEGQYMASDFTSIRDRECLSCDAGKYQGSTSHATATCSSCTSSTYQDQTGKSSCKACSNGYYRSSASSQQQCGPGWKCTGSCQRTACSKGEFQNARGQTTCKACSSTTYNDQVQQSVCKSCTSGYYAPSRDAQAVCNKGHKCAGSCAQVPCEAGAYQDQTGKTSCKPCPSNQIALGSASETCVGCTAGFYRLTASSQKQCEAGHKCNNCAKVQCTVGTTFQPTVGKTTCQPVKKCSAGQYLKTLATISSDNSCDTCPSGKFQTASSHSHRSCSDWDECLAASYVASEPTKTSDRKCGNCDGITGYSDEINTETCKTITTCGQGQYMQKDATASSQRVCKPCPPSTFMASSSHTNAQCIDWLQVCSPGFKQTQSPSAIRQRVCTACGTGTFQANSNKLTCNSIKDCPVGTYVASQPTSSSNRGCSACDGITKFQKNINANQCDTIKICSSTEYASVTPTSSSDRECSTCLTASDCASNQVLTGTCGGGTSTSFPSCSNCDASCKTCQGTASSDCLTCKFGYALHNGVCVSDCPIGTYENAQAQCVPCHASCYTCSAAGSSSCTACAGSRYLSQGTCGTNCPTDYFQVSATNNNVCSKCAICTQGKYASTPCKTSNNAQDTICSAWATCAAGTYVTQQPNSTHQRLCKDCTLNVDFSVSANAFACDTVEECDAGYEVVKDPTTTSDRTCKQCLKGTFTDTVNTGSCTQCSKGYRAATNGATTCSTCGSGMYNDALGQEKCKSIPAGSYGTGGDVTTRTGIADCEPGYQCAGGAVSPSQCNGVTAYQNQGGQATCKSTRKCSIGEYVKTVATTTSARVCDDCPVNTYMADVVHTKRTCNAVRVCAPGDFIYTDYNSTTNRVCKECNGVTGFTNQSNSPACSVVSDCAPGFEVTSDPTATSDRVCAACGTGNFSLTSNSNECTAQKDCLAGTYVKVNSTSTSDRVCEGCTLNTNYQSLINQPSCEAVIHCGAGERQLSAPSLDSNRECTACQTGTYQDSTKHDESQCKQPTTCNPGTYIQVKHTLTANAVCDACNATSYQPLENQDTCILHDTCSAGQYVSLQPNATHNRMCAPCVLGTGYREESSHIFDVCESVSACVAGTFQTAASTLTSDVSCTACPSGKYQPATGQTSCLSVEACTDQEYVSTFETKTSDRDCSTCTVLADCTDAHWLDGECGGSSEDQNPVCKACHSTCASCLGAESDQCLTCTASLYLDDTSCVSSCPDRHFADLNGVCQDCDSSCSTCSGASADACLSCDAGDFLNPDGTCLPSCPEAYYQDDKSSTCAECEVCQGQQWSSVPCSVNANTICTDWTDCPAGQEQDTQGNATADRTCVSCIEGTTFKATVGQTPCEDVTNCVFPDREKTPPAVSADRTCECDVAGCDVLVNAAFAELLCRAPSPAEAAQRRQDCCNGVSDDTLRDSIRATQDYTNRHACPGCFASVCTCDIGYIQVPSSSGPAGTVCQACNGVTDYNDKTAQTTCNPVKVCDPREQQDAAPTISSDRTCQLCPLGTTDHDSNGATPCQACDLGVSYAPEIGMLGACLSMDQCAAGYEEVLAPTLFSKRQCQICLAGTFKKLAGQDTECVNTTICKPSEYRAVDATPSSNTVCNNVTSCNSSEWRAAAATDVSDTVCEALTVCTPAEEWAIELPTPTSDRVCKAISNCDPNLEFEAAAPTTTSDRDCDLLSVCGDDEYIIVTHTSTSDRECLPIVRSDLYTQYPSEEQLSPSEPERRRDVHTQFMQLMDGYLRALAAAAALDERQFVAYVVLDQDRQPITSSTPDASIIIQVLFGSSDNVVAFNEALSGGLVPLPDGLNAIGACPYPEQYLALGTNETSAECRPRRECDLSREFTVDDGDFVQDRVCQQLTTCVEPEVELRASNETQDRLCGLDSEAQGSTNDRSNRQAGLIGGLSGGFALLLIAMVVMVLYYRRQSNARTKPAGFDERLQVSFENPLYDEGQRRGSTIHNPLYEDAEQGEGLYETPEVASYLDDATTYDTLDRTALDCDPGYLDVEGAADPEFASEAEMMHDAWSANTISNDLFEESEDEEEVGEEYFDVSDANAPAL
eukprot:m.290873 g.290873  ORF g.290873 m.290873 type:complete len:3950 (+) comp17810_c0_seq1:79-11928(+)